MSWLVIFLAPVLAPFLADAPAVADPTLWTYVRAVISTALMLGGLVFVLSGSIGVLRLPDFYTRLHAAGMTDTMGAELVIAGLIVKIVIFGWVIAFTDTRRRSSIA